MGQQGPKIRFTKVQTLPILRLPISSADEGGRVYTVEIVVVTFHTLFARLCALALCGVFILEI